MDRGDSKILIPVRDSHDFVEVQLSALPDDVEDVIEILQAELAPLNLWLRFAVEYYRQGRLDHFVRMLNPLVEEHNKSSQTGASSMLFETFGSSNEVKEQFLEILNALAAFHTVLGMCEREKFKRKGEFDKAKRYYDQAEQVDLLKGSTNVGRAVLQLAKGELSKAEKTLTDVDAFNRGSVPALLCKACTKYNGGNFRDALKLYREVFRVNPMPPPAVRLGLAYCYQKLGQMRMARKCLERTLELQEDSVEAMVGLAVLHLNEENVEEALAMLKRAYELEPYNPAVLNHLASHYFYRGEYPKALTLAQRAHKHSDGQSKAVKAESCYHIARCYHAQNDYAAALQYYNDAHRANPEYFAPQFGLGQMHLANDEPKKAAFCFERVHKAQPKNVEALKVLGHLYAKEGRTLEALKLLNTAAELAPMDAAVWLELAQLQQKTGGQLAASLKAYEKAATILKKTGKVPAELWNNLGTVRQKLGKLASAEEAYGYALRVAKLHSGAAGDFDAPCISTQFNLGRLYEERGEVDRAAEHYKQILANYPNYPEAFLRLAACEEAAGRMEEAIGWNQKALMLHARSADAFCNLGNLYLVSGDLRMAEQQFNAVLKLDGCKSDSYATIQLAWIHIQLAKTGASPSDPLTFACRAKDSEAKVDKAVEILKKVLDGEPNNLYAANGLGTACVAKGRLHEARQIFTQVREATGSCEAATTNLAQLNAATGEHATAAALYEGAAKKVPAGTKQMQLRLLQARGHFDHAKWLECRQVLQQTTCKVPTSQVLWHNLGLALLSAARHPQARAYADSIEKPPPRSVAVVTVAQRHAALARNIFSPAVPDEAELAAALCEGDEESSKGAGKGVEKGKAAGGEGEGDGSGEGAGEGEGEGGGEGSEAEVAARAALAAGVMGCGVPISDDAVALGLTTERRDAARSSAEKLTRELADEAMRAQEGINRSATNVTLKP